MNISIKKLLSILLFSSSILGMSMSIANAQVNMQGFGISEIRAGVLAHSVDRPGPNDEPLNLTRIEDISFEILFFSPNIDAFKWIGSPRPNLGATINTKGRESKAHFALTWSANIFDSGFFVEGSLGAAIHNGALDGVTEPARKLGTRVLFYEAAGIGYNIGDDFNIILFAEHASNANLASPNKGLSNLGIKLGYKF